MISTKVLVIGGGPIGLFTVFMCGMMRLRCCLLETLPVLGGQCQVLYPEKLIYDIPAFPSIEAHKLISQLVSQMSPFDPQIFLEDQAVSIAPSANPHERWQVTTSQGRIFSAASVVLCGGMGSFQPRRPPLKNLENFEEKSVFYAVKDKEIFRDRIIVIAGGGDSALDWTLSLAPIASCVHLVHRRSHFRALESSLDKLRAFEALGKISVHTPFQLHSLHGQEGKLSHVSIQDFSGSLKEIKAHYLLPFFGMDSQLGPLASWGLTLNHNAILTNPLTGETSLLGIYAAGDMATYACKLKLILTGFAEAAQIAHHIKKSLDPQSHSFVHSTTQGLPTDFS